MIFADFSWIFQDCLGIFLIFQDLFVEFCGFSISMGDVLPVHATRAGLIRGFLRLAPRMLQVLQVQQKWCFPNGEVAATTGS